MKKSIQYPDTAELAHPLETDQTAPVGVNFAKGLAMMLSQAGCRTDYVTVMGDLGQAFIMQGCEYDESLTGGYRDLGWWPLDRWHFFSRLQFISKVNGVELKVHNVDFSGIGSDPENDYIKLFKTDVCEEITHGRALLAFWDLCHVVTGYDTGKPPLLGWDLSGDKAVNNRMSNYPCAIVTYGSKYAAMERGNADREALRYAVDLGHGSAKEGLWVTGSSAWKAWEDWLLNSSMEHWRHSSINQHLREQREAAACYLDAMALRHSKTVSECLRETAETYRRQFEVICRMDTNSDEITIPGEKQSELAELIRIAAILDLEAICGLETALSLFS